MTSIDDPDERPAPGRRPGWGRFAGRRRRSRRDPQREAVAFGQPPALEADHLRRGAGDPGPLHHRSDAGLSPQIQRDDEPAIEDDAMAPRSGAELPRDRPVASTVRPYVLTRGRTRSRWHLGWETLVSTGSRDTAPEPEPAFDEERRVVELCAHPRSVAEVAAHLKIPVGVTRVVLGDLAERQVIVVHETGDTTDPEILRRIIQRLREP